jgi:hypothetical protein
MTTDDEKTPNVIALAGASPKTNRPLFAVPRRPPPGRPSDSISLAELIERITREVRAAATAEFERRHGELRAELGADVRGATSLGIASLVMNALVIIALVATLAAPRLTPLSAAGLALAALGALFVGTFKLGPRRRAAGR